MKINNLIAALIHARGNLRGDDIEVIIWGETPIKNFIVKSAPHTNDIIIDVSAIPEDDE